MAKRTKTNKYELTDGARFADDAANEETGARTSDRTLTLASLFDGSGGFPVGGLIAGITPVWASETEPFPIRVTTKRIPQMKHYGDVRKINGAKTEPVDIVTFSSPCQDLSMAGKHKGLEGTRSGLFYEAVRIIKEMRKATNGQYPKYAVWENVPGALGSNGGEDFRTVLESLCSIKGTVYVSRPKRWTVSGEIVGDGFSLAWRVLDAQYWGVPQRRKRVFVVVDFAGYRAGKILFEREGVSRHSEESYRAWKRFAGRTERSTGATSGCSVDPAVKIYGIGSRNSRGMLSDNPHVGYYGAETSRTTDCNGGNPAVNQGGIAVVKKVAPTVYGLGRETRPSIKKELQPTITAQGAGMVRSRYMIRRLTPTECARLQGFPDWWCADLGTENPTEEELTFWHRVFKVAGKSMSDNQLKKWLANPHSDSAEYKMWGNGVALPCVVFVMMGIKESAARLKLGEQAS